MIVVRNHVRRERERLGFSQIEVAVRCGFGPGNLSRIEHVEVAPRSRTLEKIAAAIGIDPRQLVP